MVFRLFWKFTWIFIAIINLSWNLCVFLCVHYFCLVAVICCCIQVVQAEVFNCVQNCWRFYCNWKYKIVEKIRHSTISFWWNLYMRGKYTAKTIPDTHTNRKNDRERDKEMEEWCFSTHCTSLYPICDDLFVSLCNLFVHVHRTTRLIHLLFAFRFLSFARSLGRSHHSTK